MSRVLIFLLLTSASFAQAIPESPSLSEERFLNKTNIALLGSLTIWHGLDAYKTEQTIDAGGREEWPVARHFCQSRERRVAYFWTNYAATIGSSYLLHRTGHRKLARAALVMGSVSSASGLIFTLAHER